MSARSTRSSVSQRSGGASASASASSVSVDDISYSHSRKVSFPRYYFRDSSSWSATFSDLTKLLLNDYSLSRALSFDPDASISSASRLAAPLLTDHEAKEYAAWERDYRSVLPRADFKRLKTALTSSTPTQKARWDELTHALRVLYHEGDISREACKAWVEKNQEKMSLLVAVKKVEQVRADASSANKTNGKAKRYVHELVACRKVVSEVGRYTIDMGAVMRAVNTDADEKEEDVTKRLVRLEREAPRRKDVAADIFKERARFYEKLAKFRKDRIDAQAIHQRQQAELNVLNTLLKARIHALERAVRRGGSSSRK